jgi:hypothetical protein
MKEFRTDSYQAFPEFHLLNLYEKLNFDLLLPFSVMYLIYLQFIYLWC